MYALWKVEGATMTDDLRERVGKAAHEAAKRVLIEQGWADHPPVLTIFNHILPSENLCESCGQSVLRKHHPDMADWEALPEERRAYFVAVGMAGYEIGTGLRKAVPVSELRRSVRARGDLVAAVSVLGAEGE